MKQGSGGRGRCGWGGGGEGEAPAELLVSYAVMIGLLSLVRRRAQHRAHHLLGVRWRLHLRRSIQHYLTVSSLILLRQIFIQMKYDPRNYMTTFFQHML